MRYIDALTSILRLKNETEFTWGQNSKRSLVYLSSPSVLMASRRGVPFRLYVAAEDKVIWVILTQETEDKEYVIMYISRWLIDAGTRSMRGQIIADFMVELRINDKYDLKVGYVTCTPWKLYFDWSICYNGQRIVDVLISPSGAIFEFSNRLKVDCTNNQVEYEALLFGLEFLQYMGVKHVEAFGDSLLVVQQVFKTYTTGKE